MSRIITIEPDTIEHLQKRLQYAETPECRASMPETDWLMFRRDLTEKFKKAIEIREFFLKADTTKKYYDLLKKMNTGYIS